MITVILVVIITLSIINRIHHTSNDNNNTKDTNTNTNTKTTTTTTTSNDNDNANDNGNNNYKHITVSFHNFKSQNFKLSVSNP